MRFRTQLSLTVGVLLTIALASGSLALVTMQTVSRRAHHLAAQTEDQLASIYAVRISAEQLVSAARGYLLGNRGDERELLMSREAAVEHSLDALRDRAQLPHIRGQLALIKQRVLDYSRATARAVTERQSSASPRELELVFERNLEAPRQALDAAVATLVDMKRAQLATEALRSGDLLRTSGMAIAAAWLSGVVITIVYAILVMRKLKAQYRREQEARQAASDAAASHKQLLDIVAHDLRTPLNAIVLGLDLVQLHGSVPHADTIANAAQRMQRLVNDLVDVSRVEHIGLERSDCAVATIIDTALDLLRTRAGRSEIQLRSSCPAELRATADRERIVQVLCTVRRVTQAATSRRPGAGEPSSAPATRRPCHGCHFVCTQTN